MRVRKYFITGLVILLPLVISAAVLIFLINFLTEPFMGLVAPLLAKLHLTDQGFLFLSSQQLLRYTSKLLILIFLFLLTIILGMVTRGFVLRSLLHLGDQVLHKIPLINTVYKTTQDIINTLFVSDKNPFKQVVLVPFPRTDVYVLGLIARDAPESCSQATHEELISVFIPTTPNPTSGFLLMFKKTDLIPIEMKPEDALKYILSCGMILPPSPTAKPGEATS